MLPSVDNLDGSQSEVEQVEQNQRLTATPAGWAVPSQQARDAPLDARGLFRKLRARVMYVSLCSGLCVVLGGVINQVVGCEGLFEVLRILRNSSEALADDDDLKHVTAEKMFVSGLPNMIFGLAMALIVPACGYYGAKWVHSPLLCCFSFCSLCGVIGGVLQLLILFWIMALIPRVDHFIQMCDPTTRCCDNTTIVCDNKGLPIPSYENQYMDCILGAHHQYRQQYREINHLEDGECATLLPFFTHCQNGFGMTEEDYDHTVTRFQKEYPDEHERYFGHNHHRHHHIEPVVQPPRVLGSEELIVNHQDEFQKALDEWNKDKDNQHTQQEVRDVFKQWQAANTNHEKEYEEWGKNTASSDTLQHLSDWEVHQTNTEGTSNDDLAWMVPDTLALPDPSIEDSKRQEIISAFQLWKGQHPESDHDFDEWWDDVWMKDDAHAAEFNRWRAIPAHKKALERWARKEKQLKKAAKKAEKDRKAREDLKKLLNTHKDELKDVDVDKVTDQFNKRVDGIDLHDVLKDMPKNDKEWDKSKDKINESVEKLTSDDATTSEGEKQKLKKESTRVWDELKRDKSKSLLESKNGGMELQPGAHWIDSQKEAPQFGGCSINDEAIDVMRTFHRNLPVLIPEMELFLVLRILVATPAFILALLGTMWGCRLWKKAKRGYRVAHAEENNLHQPLVYVQQPMMLQPMHSMAPMASMAQIQQPMMSMGQPQSPYTVQYNPAMAVVAQQGVTSHGGNPAAQTPAQMC